MTFNSWVRVAAGAQLVAQTVAKQAAKDAGTIATRAAQHGVDVAASARTAAAASHSHQWQHGQEHPNPTQYTPPINGLDAVESRSQSTKVPLNGLANHNTDTGGFASTAEPFGATAVETQPASNTRTFNENTNFQESQGATKVTGTDAPLTLESQKSETPTENLVAAENQIRSAPAVSAALENAGASPVEDEIQRLKEGRAVPSTRVGRAMGFASLGFGLAVGTAAEGVSRLFGQSSGGSVVVNDANADRLAASLCRMRGAALKMGQMLSIQDEALLPPALARALQQVRQGADAMPKYQLVKQLERQLGKEWRSNFESFDESPFAAASIGQVHRAQIRNDAGEIREVVVKVQYPGIANSIESDLNNLSMLVTWSGLAPKGLFIENVIRVGQQELKVECDYQREMKNQKHIKQLVESDPVLQENRFVVPAVIDKLTTDEIITSEYRPGGTIDKVSHLDQEERNRIGRTIMYLTMKELFVWRFMQTDPNWGNFLYDVGSRTTSLIDFGATREYSKEFVDGYLRIVWASANRDEKTLMDQSHRMNFLTGDENEQMLQAHKMSGFTVGEPFWSDEPFDFRGSNISTRMGEHTAVFLQHRLTAPPEEVYTLHRKLAGAYMLCIKLGAVIQSRDMLEEIVANHVFEDGMEHPITR
jgi:aarF domain-containing kinase